MSKILTKTRKRFDCVAMKRRGTEYVYAQTHGMSREEELAYWRKLEREMLPVVPRRACPKAK